MEQRYIGHDNGTITDHRTGLMWQEKYAYPETGNYITWHEAREYVHGLNEMALGGHSDWRLPSRLEIQSLYEIGYNFQSRGRTYVLHIDPIFEFSYGSCFWTGVTRLSGALGFEFDRGEVNWYPQGSLSGTARAVRLNMDPFKLLEFYPARCGTVK